MMKQTRSNALKPMAVLGVMSGTSIDAVDYALCKITPNAIKLLEHWQVTFPSSLQKQLHAAAANQISSYALAQLHHDLGRFYAKHARSVKSRKAHLVGLHGQTIFHQPEQPAPATFQLGEPAYLGEALRIPVVSNFRPGDLAADGQGAPLASVFHRAVFAQQGKHICVNNLGGISNVTSMDWRGKKLRILAFDTGPANILIDMAVRHFTGGKQRYDMEGRWASTGQADENLLAKLLKHSFFRRSPPKSTGRELFGEQYLASLLGSEHSPKNTVATLTELTARSIALNYQMHLPCPPARVILAGGGALNPVLVGSTTRELQKTSPETEVVTCETLGWPVQTIEPAAFAYLAWLRWNGVPGNIPETTGAKRAVLLGQMSGP